MFGRVSAGRFSRMFSRPHSGGCGSGVACVSRSAAPRGSRLRSPPIGAERAALQVLHVQLAADAASLAAAEAIARHPDPAGETNVDDRASQGRRCRFRQSRSAAWRRRDACGRGEEHRRRGDGECRLCGAGPEQFRLGARLRRGQRRRFGDLAQPCRRSPLNVGSLSRSACGYVSIWPQCRCKPRRLGYPLADRSPSRAGARLATSIRPKRPSPPFAPTTGRARSICSIWPQLRPCGLSGRAQSDRGFEAYAAYGRESEPVFSLASADRSSGAAGLSRC